MVYIVSKNKTHYAFGHKQSTPHDTHMYLFPCYVAYMTRRIVFLYDKCAGKHDIPCFL